MFQVNILYRLHEPHQRASFSFFPAQFSQDLAISLSFFPCSPRRPKSISQQTSSLSYSSQISPLLYLNVSPRSPYALYYNILTRTIKLSMSVFSTVKMTLLPFLYGPEQQRIRTEVLATCLSVRLFARTAHSFTPSLISLTPSLLGK